MFIYFKKCFFVFFLSFFSSLSLFAEFSQEVSHELQQKIWNAVTKDDVKTLKEMHKKGVDLHKQKSLLEESLLLYAANFKSLEVMKYFIEELNFDVNLENHIGQNALIKSVISEDEKSIRYLISKGANLNAKSISDHSAVYWALFKQNIVILQMLLEAGADFNVNTNKHERAIFNIISLNNSAFYRNVKETLRKNLKAEVWSRIDTEMSFFKRVFRGRLRK